MEGTYVIHSNPFIAAACKNQHLVFFIVSDTGPKFGDGMVHLVAPDNRAVVVMHLNLKDAILSFEMEILLKGFFVICQFRDIDPVSACYRHEYILTSFSKIIP